jgi:hypothetical protein
LSLQKYQKIRLIPLHYPILFLTAMRFKTGISQGPAPAGLKLIGIFPQ